MAELPGAQGQPGTDVPRGLIIEDVRGWQLWQVSCAPGREAALADRLRAAGTGELPLCGATVSVHGAMRLYALAPRSWWWLAAAGTPVDAVAAALDPAVGSLTPLSAARVRIALSGPDAPALLQKGIAVDLHPRAFPVGRAIFTALDHVGVMLERSGEEHWELFVPTTWSVSVREWLLDAAIPFLQARGAEQTTGVP